MDNYFQALVVLLFACLIHLAFSTSYSDSMAAASITEIVKNFSEKSISLDFIVYRCQLHDLVDEIMKAVEKPAKVIKYGKSTELFHVIQSAIVFADHKDLAQFQNQAVLVNEFPQDFYFYVYIANFNGKLEQVSSLEFLDQNQIHRLCYYLLENKDFIELVTFTTFQQPNCRHLNRVTVNRFSKESSKWETDKFAIEKFRNFNGCELKVFKRIPNNGFSGVIYRLFESSLNFTTKLVNSIEEEDLEKSSLDFVVNFAPTRTILRDNQKVENKLEITHFLFEGYQLLVVTRFPPYSILDKALLPFDPEVWWWLIGFLTVGVVCIIVVSFMREKVKEFVFGLGVRAQLLNLV
jgi:hypothetical protein